jgi:hypothetical protein
MIDRNGYSPDNIINNPRPTFSTINNILTPHPTNITNLNTFLTLKFIPNPSSRHLIHLHSRTLKTHKEI